jgi:hypothetical protein
MNLSEISRSQLLTVDELTQRWVNSLYPVSAITLARWRRDSRGPKFLKIGAAGRIYYLLESILEFEHDNNILLINQSTNANS